MRNRLICLIVMTLLCLALSQAINRIFNINNFNNNRNNTRAANINRFRRGLGDHIKDQMKDEIKDKIEDEIKDQMKDKVKDQFKEEVQDEMEEHGRDEVERKLAEEAKLHLLSNLDNDQDAGIMFDDIISILNYLHAIDTKDLEDKVVEEILSKVVNITSLSAIDIPVLYERTKHMTFDELQELHDGLCEFQEKKMPGNVICSANRTVPPTTPSADSSAAQRLAVAEALKADSTETTLAPESSAAPVSSSLWTLGMVFIMLAVCK